MLELRELQQAFADAIVNRDIASFVSRVRSNHVSATDRLHVYRNNVFISLTQALADMYPVVERLVGDEFFRFVARRFIRSHPSRSGNLHEFGRELAVFLRELTEARDLPYLGDVAALEWSYHEVFHAADAERLDVEELSRVPTPAHDGLRFRLHPATRLVASRYPIFAIWRANQQDEPPLANIDLDAGGDYLVVARRDLDRIITGLSAGEFAFLLEVANGATLAQACETALAADPDIDIGIAVRRFVTDGTIAGFHRSLSPELSNVTH